MKYIIGIDIGGTKCAVILGRERDEMEIADKIVFPTEKDNGYESNIDRFFLTIETMLRKNDISLQEVKGIGISCGGPLDSKKGIILSPPNLVGWDNVKIVEIFEKKYGIHTKLQNDANACALAEWKYGAAKGFNNVIFLTFGTGMGAGLILDGKLYSGTNDMAGEVGHVRLDSYGPVGFGKAGSFEGFCSGGGIAQLGRMKVLEKLQMGEKVSFCEDAALLSGLNAKIIGDAADNGDPLAIDIYRISGEYLGRGLAMLIDILNPEIIVIGSIFARSRELLWPYAKKVIEAESLVFSRQVCRVVPAGLGERIGDFAALATAQNGQ